VLYQLSLVQTQSQTWFILCACSQAATI